MSNKCPECVSQGLKSCVYPGGCTSTLMHCPPFYDEDGKMHTHDRNIRTQYFSCSNGHKWEEKEIGSCWCGWPNKKSDSFDIKSSEDNSIASIKKGVDGVEFF